MTWGNSNSAAARAVERRARKGLDSPAWRRVLKRGARERHTLIRVVPETENEERQQQTSLAFRWPFR